MTNWTEIELSVIQYNGLIHDDFRTYWVGQRKQILLFELPVTLLFNRQCPFYVRWGARLFYSLEKRWFKNLHTEHLSGTIFVFSTKQKNSWFLKSYFSSPQENGRIYSTRSAYCIYSVSSVYLATLKYLKKCEW